MALIPPDQQLTVTDRNLLVRYYEHYHALDSGTKTPQSEAGRRFVRTCRGECEPSTTHEIAYRKFRTLQQTGHAREQDIRSFKQGQHIHDPVCLNNGLFINPIHRARLPLPSETCAICRPNQAKRAALLFDRIHVIGVSEEEHELVPELTFYCDRFENNALEWAYQSADEELIDSQIPDDLSDDEIETEHERIRSEIERTEEFEEYISTAYLEILFSQYVIKAGIKPVLVLGISEDTLTLLVEGRDLAFLAALDNVPIINESQTSWRQIVEFKSDHEAHRKYRDLSLWLRTGLSATSRQEATDVIGRMVDDYAEAIRKHGFRTKLSLVQFIFDARQLLPSTTVGATSALLTGSAQMALLGSGLVLGAQTVAWAAKRRLALGEVQRGENREVAILYDLQNKFGSSVK